MTKPGPLLDALNTVYCQGGATQIERVLRHALGEFEGSSSIKAIVYIGDACEENADTLNALAIQCRLARRPLAALSGRERCDGIALLCVHGGAIGRCPCATRRREWRSLTGVVEISLCDLF